MQQNPYFRFLRSWSALILIGIVVSVVATHYALGERVSLYRATSTMQVGRLLDEKSPQQNDLAVAERLIPAYREKARRDPVLEATIDELDLAVTANDIRSRMLVIAVPQTQLIDIQIIDSDPEIAAAIANEIARQIVEQSPDPGADEESLQFIQSQLADLQAKISDAQAEAEEINSDILELASAAQVFEAQQRIELLNIQIDAWQLTYGSLLSSANPGQSNIVRVVSDATPPSQPIPTQASLYYGLAVVVGGGLSTLLALGLSTLGRNLRHPNEVSALAEGVPVVPIPRYRIPVDGMPVALRDPDSSATSSYRILRNTLRVRQLDQGHLTLAVTSSRTGEGKTTTVANLGVALANSGLSVLLVDANLRNPELDQVLGLDGETGFADLLLGDVTLDTVRQPTDHPNLTVIGAGIVPVHYTDLLSSTRLSSLVAELSESADVVIFDTPALFQEQESQLLARLVNGVLVIAEAGRVSGADLEKTLDNLERADASVIAIALNKTHERRWSLDRLPWSRDARLRERAAAQRQRHMRPEHLEQQPHDARHVHSAAD